MYLRSVSAYEITSLCFFGFFMGMVEKTTALNRTHTSEEESEQVHSLAHTRFVHEEAQRMAIYRRGLGRLLNSSFSLTTASISY